MLKLKNMSITTKMFLLIVVFVVGFGGFAWVSYRTINELKVNGPVYKQIVLGKDLIADILPPPEYIIEAYLVTREMAGETDRQHLNELAHRCEALKKDYDTRHAYWEGELPDGEMKQTLLEKAHRPAEAFFKVRDEEFIPAVMGGDGAKAGVAIEKLRGLYEQHRLAINDVVGLATAFASDQEQAAARMDRKRMMLMAGIGAVIFGVVLVVNIVFSRRLVGAIVPLVERTEAIANKDLTGQSLAARSGDELGRLTESVNRMSRSLGEIVSAVGGAARDVAGAATEISTSSEQMAGGMQEQTGQVTQISAAVEELSASIVEVAKKSADAAAQASESGKTAEEGGRIVEGTIEGMNQISQTVSASAADMQELGKRGEQIGRVIEVINDIADQTNLLALNAAIEAARAGENGRGFAVVADEVRKLADRTTKATEEIAGSIKAIQSQTSQAAQQMNTGTEQVKAGVTQATNAGESLRQIVSSAQAVAGTIRSIAATAEEQSLASQQISKNVEVISSATLQTNEGANQAASAASQLSKKAEQLQALVSEFKTSGGAMSGGVGIAA